MSAGLLRFSTLWLGLVPLAMVGCVIRYGEGPGPAPEVAEQTAAQGVEFRGLERQIAGLVDSAEDVDARNRLELAWALAEDMEDADPGAQRVVRAYLEALIEVETRARPVVTPLQTRSLSEGFSGSAEVETAELAGPEPVVDATPKPEVSLLDPMALEGEPDGAGEAVASDTDAPGPDVDALLREAVRLLEARKPLKAMEVLDACRNLPCWEAVEPSRNRARDAHVFASKEALAVKFLELRGEAVVEVQRAGLLEIQGELSALRAAWPSSEYADEIEAHMARVQKELELLPEE